jgi:hypothetical protein
MTDRMTAAEFVERVRGSWDDWYGLVACITAGRASDHGFHKDWTLTDVIAHIGWYENQMIDLLEARRFVGSKLWELPTDERNEIIRKENADRDHAEVLREARRTHDRMVELLDVMSDEEFYDPGAFPGMPEEWTPAQVFEGSTFEHYEGHAELVREYLAKRRGA